jgi:concentrative nucleoside transporter, CNT family
MHLEQLISFIGLFVMVLLAWAMSSNRRKIPWRVIVWGISLQFLLAILMLKVPPVRRGVEWFGDMITGLLGYVDIGCQFVFGDAFKEHFFAFRVLPSIIFFSALMALLYHLRIIPLVVRGLAWVMQRTMRTSGAETLSATANIFVGQTEAPLMVKPYLSKMTASELTCVMVGGFATVAGGVMAVYISFGIDPVHLITASVISAPATLVIAKVMRPEEETPETADTTKVEIPKAAENILDAVTQGTSDGLKLALNVAAMLIVFLALVAAINGILGYAGRETGMAIEGQPYNWSLERGLGYLFYPFAWIMGVPESDCSNVGSLLGIRMATNEIIAYQQMSTMDLSDRAKMIATYALCGFANLGSIGIVIGGLGAMAENKRKELARLAFPAMLGGTLAAFMTACIVGVLL